MILAIIEGWPQIRGFISTISMSGDQGEWQLQRGDHSSRVAIKRDSTVYYQREYATHTVVVKLGLDELCQHNFRNNRQLSSTSLIGNNRRPNWHKFGYNHQNEFPAWAEACKWYNSPQLQLSGCSHFQRAHKQNTSLEDYKQRLLCIHLHVVTLFFFTLQHGNNGLSF